MIGTLNIFGFLLSISYHAGLNVLVFLFCLINNDDADKNFDLPQIVYYTARFLY